MHYRPSLLIMALLYLAAGVNHFWHPLFYIRIIPGYLPARELLNSLAGIAELVLALLLFPLLTRKWAAYGIMAMLIAFLPTHTWMIEQCHCDWFSPNGIFLWARLLLGQPLLIWWAWSNRK